MQSSKEGSKYSGDRENGAKKLREQGAGFNPMSNQEQYTQEPLTEVGANFEPIFVEPRIFVRKEF